MATVKFDFNFKGATSNASAKALIKQGQAFFDACAAAGFEMRGNGIDARFDPEAPAPEVKPAPAPKPVEPAPAAPQKPA